LFSTNGYGQLWKYQDADGKTIYSEISPEEREDPDAYNKKLKEQNEKIKKWRDEASAKVANFVSESPTRGWRRVHDHEFISDEKIRLGNTFKVWILFDYGNFGYNRAIHITNQEQEVRVLEAFGDAAAGEHREHKHEFEYDKDGNRYEKYFSDKFLQEVDCKHNQVRAIGNIKYSGNMGAGKAMDVVRYECNIDESEGSCAWKPISTHDYYLFVTACGEVQQ
jgi:hypothetical protein